MAEVLTPAESFVGKRVTGKLTAAAHMLNDAIRAAKALTPDVLVGLNANEACALVEYRLRELRSIIAGDHLDEAGEEKTEVAG